MAGWKRCARCAAGRHFLVGKKGGGGLTFDIGNTRTDLEIIPSFPPEGVNRSSSAMSIVPAGHFSRDLAGKWKCRWFLLECFRVVSLATMDIRLRFYWEKYTGGERNYMYVFEGKLGFVASLLHQIRLEHQDEILNF